MAAYATDASTSGDDVKEIDTITVTGSRLSNPNVVSPTPISVLTAEDIKATGAINIGDLLTTMPQLATSFTMGNSGRFIGTAGVAMQDLRNLGTARTLVLVNGRRFVGSSAGSSAVDTNLIPADWVERVEIITGGASAVYGADAVSGVVNFILKKDYEGANLHAQLGTSEAGFDKQLISITAGTEFADGRGHIAGSLEHSRQEALEFRDRFGHQAYREMRTPGNTTDKVLMPDGGSYLVTNGGTFSLGSSTDISRRYVFDPDGSVRRQRFDGLRDSAGGCTNCDRSDSNQTLQLQPDYRRTTLSGVAGFDLNQDHRLYFEGTYSQVDSKTQSSPAFGSATTNSAYIVMPDNAYIQPDLAALMKGKSIKVSRSDRDAGRRGEDTQRKTGRVVFGAEGMLSGDWQYDTSLVYGRTDETRHNLNNRINERFYAGLDAVRDPATGNIVCRSQIAPKSVNQNFFNYTDSPDGIISPAVAQSCVPFSIFGAGAINPAAADWFNTTTVTKSRLTQFVAGGTLTNNNLFELPGGSASFATGVEYRRETSRQDTDPLDVSGQTFLNAIPSSHGSYDVGELYAEIALPLISNEAFGALSFDAAARYSGYSTVGHTNAWRYGLDWAVNETLRLRGTVSSAVRAPNIDELYGGQSQNFFSVTDPCSAVEIKNGKNPAQRAANCAALGVPANFTAQNTGTIEGLSGSNPDLDPETGRSWTAGFVFTPQFLPGFGMNVDYWNIKLSDAITSVSGSDTAKRCVDSPSGIDNVYCASATRDAGTHELNFIRTLQQNIAATNTDGVDIGVYYSHDLAGGKLRADLNATRVLHYTDYPFQEDPGESIEQNGTLGFPKWKASLQLGYSINQWAFNWNTRYFSEGLRVSNDSFRSNPTSTTPIRAGSGVFHDLRGSYAFDSGWQVYAGITNVFDADPPVNLFGTGFGSGLYDAMGRSYYAGFNYRF
ncbi:outer membrane receptor protein involved in Fe transport [Lysobacter niastensis]|uniref:Outer membrane receptor protein involved in Fe transport n=1 Tax=Lysobacter niastensis TaxID=380629 RepID=A0ABU1W6G3_9GAMM|nr:TonB-dependent receptor [Lysobacter niastensis]MDR7133052.1 outer membrane receptor protein involved in Fe transport [Lysobacter niastensis]